MPQLNVPSSEAYFSILSALLVMINTLLQPLKNRALMVGLSLGLPSIHLTAVADAFTLILYRGNRLKNRQLGNYLL